MYYQFEPIPGCGSMTNQNNAPTLAGTPVIRLPGTCQNRSVTLNLSDELLSRHSLLVGGTGSGKTKLMTRMLDNILKNKDSEDVVVVFDSKGDYRQAFSGIPHLVVGNSAEYRAISQRWNIFEELLVDGTDDENVRLNAIEIARTLFADRMKNTTNAFFPSAAQDVFSSLMLSVCRDARSDDNLRAKLLNNRGFTGFLQSSSPALLCDQLAFYPDLTAVSSYIAGENEQSQGVLSEMYSVIRDLFIGAFCQEGDFSIRRFIRNHGLNGKKVLFLEYDISIGSVLSPIYRLLVDLAFKECLRQNNGGRRIWFFFDEFKLLPHLQHIDDAVNFGRSKGVRVFAGLQSVEQLYDIYGQSRGRNVAAGFSSVYAFHANDASTMKYVSDLYGANRMALAITDEADHSTRQIISGRTIEDWDIAGLEPGWAVVCLPKQQPFKMYMKQYPD